MSQINFMLKNQAVKFVVLLGIVSLFADMTYEGARSITGPYLAFLGASSVAVGFIAGFGELLGYSLRLISGYLADRTQKYWTITILGYICNLLAVPLLALTNHWQGAAVLIILERTGKAIRTPARDAMLSHAGHAMGMGWGFGLHEALDQLGAMLGPLLIATVLYFKGEYHYAFAVLAIPAFLAIILLLMAARIFPHPKSLEIPSSDFEIKELHSHAFWIYTLAASLIAVGYADFALISYHFEKMAILPSIWIPIAYALAMGVDGLAALLLGHFYDKRGFIILIIITAATCIFAPLVFMGNSAMAVIGIILWSVGMGAHESLMRAVVAKMVPTAKRASAYGIFNMSFGVFWFIGSITMGILYKFSIPFLVIFSVGIQLSALPLLWFVKIKQNSIGK